VSVKRYLRATCLSIGAAVMVSIAALTQPSPGVQAQPAAPSPAPKPAGPATTPAPRAGGFPVEMAMPLLAGGAAAAGAGAYLLRRKRR
jgi:LPXTG-motif cell wall-anchored protein